MGELINQSQRSLIYREPSAGGSNDILWKVSSPAINSVAELSNEFEVTSNLQIQGIRSPLGTGIYQNKEAFSYDFIPGISLKKLISIKKFTVEEFLHISIKICNILVQLHATGYNHLRINSNNILISEQETVIHLIDFSLASSSAFNKLIDFQSWGEELSYIAPEQTGRLNQVVDNRTDLYSLGIVFYELLTGAVPFMSRDSAEIVLNHLIETPPSVATINKKIPLKVSEIVDKLLAKKADDRYQSAYGLMRDLQSCIENLRNKLTFDRIELGKFDRSHQLKMSSVLYGRKRELDTIRELIEKAAVGSSELVFLAGDTGMGKTALVEEVKKLVHEKQGILLTESFDATKQNQPYHGAIAALKELAAGILSESDARLAEWRSIIGQAAEDYHHQIIEIIPEFEWVLGEYKRSSFKNDNFDTTQVSFSTLYQKILAEISIRKGLLVLFLDDLQWADPSSWKTIHSLATNQDLKHLLLICSYRTNDLENLPFNTEAIKQLKTVRTNVTTIKLSNLKPDDVFEFVSGSLVTDELDELTRITYEKTLGHPFFLHQFFRLIYRERILQFNHDRLKWSWDKEKIKDVQVTDNVVDFITKKIEQLPASSRQILMVASCIGNSFDYPVLQHVLGIEEGSLQNHLNYLLNERILELRNEKVFSFSHERVRETAYAILDGKEKSATHYALANQLAAATEAELSDQHLYELANHFNESVNHIQDSDRNRVIHFNFRAGMQAKQSAAFEVAYRYFVAGIKLSRLSDWNTHYAETLKLYNEATEVAMINGKQHEAKSWLDLSVKHSKSINDSIKAHEIWLNHLSENHNFPEAVAYLLEVLRQLGFDVPRSPGKITILKEYVKVKWLLKNKRIEDIPELPSIDNDRAKAFLKLTVNSLASIFGNAPDILPIIIFTQVRLSLTHGNSVYSPIAYCSYGFALCVFTGDLDKGYRFGKMALALTDKLQAEIVRAKVLVQFYAFLSYWKDPIRESVAPLRDAYVIGRKNGDFLYSAFGLSFHSAIRLHSGDNLAELLETMSTDCHLIRNMNQELVYIISESQRQLVISLRSKTSKPWLLRNDDFDEEQMLGQLDKLGDSASKFDIYYYKLFLAVIFNEYSIGAEYSESAAIYEDETTARQITYPTFLLFSTIAIIKHSARETSLLNRQRLRRKIQSRLKLLEKITRHAPDNFTNKLMLLKAIVLEERNEFLEAGDQYHESIVQAQRSNFIHEEAIAREHLAYMYMKINNHEYAELMLQKSYDCYEKWGADAKCTHLRELYPDIIGKAEGRNKEGIAGFQNIYDLNMIIDANQALSSENTLEGLLKRFMEIVMKNASASNAAIVLRSPGGRLELRAVASSEGISIPDAFNTDEEQSTQFPASVVNYVARSLTTYTSSNLMQERIFAYDSYVQLKSPLSACCIPIVTNDRFIGAIYLENNLAEAAFNEARIGIFKTIASQLGISLDNVFLYEQMEQKVIDRTMELVQKNTELSKEKKKSDDLLLNILPAETAEELKNNGRTTARLYKDATVLFTDIREFSRYAELLSPEQLVLDIDFYFRGFDEICTQHGLEKIKTIGDAYMAVGGVPENNKANVIDVMEAAVHMLQFTRDAGKQRNLEGKHFFEIRVGIHTGPVVAGVVGIKKFQFDLWGDTVNIAARMEQNSQPGKINISQQTYELIKHRFDCTPRGKIKAKSLGEIDMYFVDWESKAAHLSSFDLQQS